MSSILTVRTYLLHVWLQNPIKVTRSIRCDALKTRHYRSKFEGMFMNFRQKIDGWEFVVRRNQQAAILVLINHFVTNTPVQGIDDTLRQSPRRDQSQGAHRCESLLDVSWQDYSSAQNP